MKVASYEVFNIGFGRIAIVGLACSALVAFGLWSLSGDALGQAGTAVILGVALLVFYMVMTAPKRMLESSRVSQARESLLLSASAQACLMVTGSRSRTFMLLRPKEPSLAAAVREVARKVLLGNGVVGAVAESKGVTSYSAAAVLRAAASMRAREYEAGDEESRGLAASSELGMETKLPLFMTVCFFAPIVLTLYAVFSHTYDPPHLFGLAVFEFAVIDLTYYFSSPDRGQH